MKSDHRENCSETKFPSDFLTNFSLSTAIKQQIFRILKEDYESINNSQLISKDINITFLIFSGDKFVFSILYYAGNSQFFTNWNLSYKVINLKLSENS